MRASTFRWWLIAALTAGVLLAAYSVRRQTAGPPVPSPTPVVLVPETGVVHDLTDRNNGVLVAKPGDVITVPLIGDVGAGFQWSFRSPVAGGYLSLKRHTVTEEDPRLQPKQALSEWVFKIEKAATFNLRLDYENPIARRRATQKIFRVKIVADRSAGELPNILVDEPLPQAVAAGALHLAGYARRPVETVYYTVADEAAGQLLKGELPLAAENSGFAYFEKDLRFRVPEAPGGTIEISDGQKGSQTTVIPLVFHPDRTLVRVYWSNAKLGSEQSCEKVFAVKRVVPKTAEPWNAAIAELLAGPTAAERRAGYATSLPSGVKLTSVTVADGVATADFTSSLERGVAGSCRVTAILAQLEQTVKQFSDVQSVVVSIDGKTEGILQP